MNNPKIYMDPYLRNNLIKLGVYNKVVSNHMANSTEEKHPLELLEEAFIFCYAPEGLHYWKGVSNKLEAVKHRETKHIAPDLAKGLDALEVFGLFYKNMCTCSVNAPVCKTAEGFIWKRSPEGYDFWDDISNKLGETY